MGHSSPEPRKTGTEIIEQERRTAFVALFRTTPVNTLCPNFYVLSHANGCAFEPACSYCYLKSSFPSLGRPRVFVNTDQLLHEASEWIRKDKLESYVLNTGNLSDSMVFEPRRPIMGQLVELFRTQAEQRGRPHTLLLVTKAGSTLSQALIQTAPTRNVVVSFSVNAPEAARRFESGAPPVNERITAARELKRHGWRVRIRVDPMILGFDYQRITKRVDSIQPERLTLGSLRSEPSLLRFLPKELAKDLDLSQPGTGLFRYPQERRLELYATALTWLTAPTEIGLCEETPAVSQQLLGHSRPCCNCGL